MPYEKKEKKNKKESEIEINPELNEDDGTDPARQVVTRATPSAAERIKRSRALQRRRSKLKVGRARAVSKKASTKELYDRARRAVVRNVKKDFAGGRDPRDLSPAEKDRVEKQLQRKKNYVDNAVFRMMKVMRQKEAERLNIGSKDKNSEKKPEKKSEE